MAERERLVADLSDTKVMLLRNHGTLALGASAGEAFGGIYALEKACKVQVRTLTAGRDNVIIAPPEAQIATSHYDLVWQAALRKVRRQCPGFDA